MTDVERLTYLKLALRVVGVIAIFGFYPLTVLWPSGWAWSSGRSELSRDDHRYLRDLRCLSDHCLEDQ